jgi:ParB-like chromosome segregation protein Spo0J
MPTTTTKTARKVRYQPVLNLPKLPYDQFMALRDNIALHGVLVPILVDGDGSRRKIIDGSYRKAIADELGYDCPEIVQDGLTEDEKRTLARALNLARRQLSQNRWVDKQLGVHHATVASIRAEMEATGQFDQLERTVGKARPAWWLPEASCSTRWLARAPSSWPGIDRVAKYLRVARKRIEEG